MPDTQNLISQFYVTIDNSDAPAEFMRDLEQIIVENSLHLPDVATLILHDARLKWVDAEELSPGRSLQIAAKRGSDAPPLFDGEIVEMEPDFGTDTPRMIVRAFDRLHRLARGRHVRTFVNVTDEDLVKKLAQEVGLQAQVGPTTHLHTHLFQSNETNLAFLQRRAATLGYLLYVDQMTLYCVPPTTAGTAVDLAWGATMPAFRPRLTTIGQVNSVTVRSWDPETKREVVGQPARNDNRRYMPQVGIQQSGGEMARQAFNLEAAHLVTDHPIRSQAVADALAQVTADRLSGRFIEAEGTSAGNPALIAGVSVAISAVGDRFSGTYFVTSTTHNYHRDEGYRTDFSVSGLNPATLLSLFVPEPVANPINGLVIGMVIDNQDPENLGRVKVTFPWLSMEHTSDWVRVVMIGAGAERGLLFLPEVDDEVLIGFELGDIEHPYVLGGLWNGKDKPPKETAEVVGSGGNVEQRVICSRQGHMIILDDSETQGGITIKTKGDMVVEAEGEVRIKGKLIHLN